MNLLDILKSTLFLCSRHATARDNIIRRVIINNLCLLTLSQQIWELILGILIIFLIADSYIAINTLIIYINKLNKLTLIYGTVFYFIYLTPNGNL
jgi:hypothetical protein